MSKNLDKQRDLAKETLDALIDAYNDKINEIEAEIKSLNDEIKSLNDEISILKEENENSQANV